MTGEITLRGKVLPIGGLKEKLLASHRHGILEAIVPKDNEKDLPDIPKNIRKDMRIHFVKHMDEVLVIALEKPVESLPSVSAPAKSTQSTAEEGRNIMH